MGVFVEFLNTENPFLPCSAVAKSIKDWLRRGERSSFFFAPMLSFFFAHIFLCVGFEGTFLRSSNAETFERSRTRWSFEGIDSAAENERSRIRYHYCSLTNSRNFPIPTSCLIYKPSDLRNQYARLKKIDRKSLTVQ